MNEQTVDALSLEPERYELYADIESAWEAARREFFDFLQSDGLVVVSTLDAVPGVGESSGRRGGPGISLPQEIGVWLFVGVDGQVIASTGKVEVGQNIRTSLTQIIADELEIAPDSIRLLLGDTDVSPYDMGTVGSRTTPVIAPQMRRVARAARAILQNRDTPLTGQQILKAVGPEADAPPEERSPAAHAAPLPRVNGRALVTGGHRYTSDVTLPGMLYGKVLRSPFANARRVSLDTSAAEALPGVTVVRDGDFVGVVAPKASTASRAIAAVRADWDSEGKTPSSPPPSSETVNAYFLRNPALSVPGYGGPTIHTEGDLTKGLEAARHVHQARYTAAYIAHAPLEPRAAVAQWSDKSNQSRLTVWTGTQRPFGVRAELAQILGISEERIRVIVPDTGAGYGGKHTGDAALEAARLAKAVAGRPVKVFWTREEEFNHAYFRPAGVIDLRSGMDSDGKLVAWEHHNYNSGAAAIRPVYRIPHQQCEFHPVDAPPLRQGSYRALAATFNHFARETHVDELAYAIGMDPLTFRLQNLDNPRLRDVLTAAAERFGWGESNAAPQQGFGIAGGHEKGSYVATCAEVRIDPATGAVCLVRAVTAFECGALICPDNVRAQVEGAIIQGIGGALFEQVLFADNKVLNGCFDRYRLPRFSDVPALETVLLDRPDLPSVGAGETPIVAIAPAVGNAIFAATGVRLRSLPLVPNGLPRVSPC